MNTNNKIPVWFWIVSIIALIWNIMGVMAYLGQAYMTEEILNAMPEADQNFYHNIPAWVTAVFAVAVFSGLFGSVALIIKKKWAIVLFIMSLLTILAQQVYNFFIQDFVTLSGQRLYMPVMIVVFAIFLIWFSRFSKSKGWIS
ncbi:hypothetical protein SAMN04487910_0711 [Aquimarina amphilecti]|uniref:Sugar transporter n=1 Tax=Aquimarina amphilecti TaxID=1038014 RepID=A0A1H7HS32_AQUAM|nr:hypothetical protein [Aquimarina amphilecti]SEK51830.1 hypothetical protein SAMN04487910_0711 [Aquimarina amphilecti]